MENNKCLLCGGDMVTREDGTSLCLNCGFTSSAAAPLDAPAEIPVDVPAEIPVGASVDAAEAFAEADGAVEDTSAELFGADAMELPEATDEFQVPEQEPQKSKSGLVGALVAIAVLALIIVALWAGGVFHKHDFATLESKGKDTSDTVNCEIYSCECGETSGVPHDWKEAACDAPRTCEKCNMVDGDALGHSFSGDTCSICGKSKWDALHDWMIRVAKAGGKLNDKGNWTMEFDVDGGSVSYVMPSDAVNVIWTHSASNFVFLDTISIKKNTTEVTQLMMGSGGRNSMYSATVSRSTGSLVSLEFTSNNLGLTSSQAYELLDLTYDNCKGLLQPALDKFKTEYGVGIGFEMDDSCF